MQPTAMSCLLSYIVEPMNGLIDDSVSASHASYDCENPNHGHGALGQFHLGTVKDVSKDIAAANRIRYGGIMKGTNAEALFAQPDSDGGLIGGASLKAEFFNVMNGIPK